MPFVRPIAGRGIVWQSGVFFEDVQPTTQWLFVEEDLSRHHKSLYLPPQSNAVIGIVVKVGPEAAAAGIQPGDRVVYEEWMGGRWIFSTREGSDKRGLMLSIDYISAIIRDA